MIRPTIIKSALEQPSPGWLEGIKVADPLILAYASRGLTHLPGRAENVIDIVPVDDVANACVAAAVHPGERSHRTLDDRPGKARRGGGQTGGRFSGRLPQERLLRSNRTLTERVTRMVRIYGAYTELDCGVEDHNTQALFRSLAPEDRVDLSFDTAAIDWGVYLQEIHLPQVRRLAGGG